MAETILVATDRRGVATVTLNRPEVSNAFDNAMLTTLNDAFARLSSDASVRVVVMRGAGKNFSSGADLKAIAAGEREAVDPVEILRRIDECPKPTIALVQGACIGGGVAWVSACDIVIAEEDAFFAIPEVRIGFCPSPMIPFFVGALGTRALRRFALTGERFGAAEALWAGLAHDLCPAGGLDAAAAPLIDALLHGAPRAAAETKRIIAEVASGAARPEALERHFAGQRSGAEAQEGRAAFREKRKPAWYPEP
jgi:methylglutaconyl-CoA hydratase